MNDIDLNPATPLAGSDPFHLARFVQAQAAAYAPALAELRAGHKRSHWMWFVFPQCAGLGISAMSQRYAISSLAEADAYLRHPLLGARLHECTRAVNELSGLSARQIFSTPDDMKFCSSMTLFERICGPDSAFATALEKYFAGQRDAKTLELLRFASAGGDEV